MTSHEAIARLARPNASARRRYGSIGDGPVCPVTPSHGPTFMSRDKLTFRCPDQSHDGVTRAVWPNRPEA